MVLLLHYSTTSSGLQTEDEEAKEEFVMPMRALLFGHCTVHGRDSIRVQDVARIQDVVHIQEAPRTRAPIQLAEKSMEV